MKIIKLNAIDSTNSYLKDMSKNLDIEDTLVVLAKTQTKGRGQMGANWQSKTGESLTFSMFKKFENLLIVDQPKIAFSVSIGVKNGLEKFQTPQVSIKWPNDIMSYQKKIGGILIENQTKGEGIISSIIGVGINVNETVFENLPHASSMRLHTGVSYNIEEVLHVLCNSIIEQLKRIDQKDDSSLLLDYNRFLFRRNVVSAFETNSGKIFNGIIRSVNQFGELEIESESDSLIRFKLKELKMRF